MYVFILPLFRRKNLHKRIRVYLPLRYRDFTARVQNLIRPCLLAIMGQEGDKKQRAWRMNHCFLGRSP